MSTRFLALASLLLSSLASHASETACPAVEGLQDFSCASSMHGRVYARDAADARQLADDLSLSAAAFTRHFSRPAPHLAVVLVAPGETLAETDKQLLLAQGADMALAWPGHSAHADMMRTGMQSGGPAAQALAANPELQRTIWRNVTRHELGHVAFNFAFWPDYLAQRGHGHAGSPDWLNEMAAMLQEPDTAAAHRRRMLAMHLASEAPALPSLTALLSMRNPARPSGDQAPAPGTGVTLVYRGDAAGASQQASALYYAQVQAFADFLVDSTPVGTIGAITTAIAGGQSFEQWLSADSHAHGLPSDMAGLEALWNAWLARPTH